MANGLESLIPAGDKDSFSFPSEFPYDHYNLSRGNTDDDTVTEMETSKEEELMTELTQQMFHSFFPLEESKDDMVHSSHIDVHQRLDKEGRNLEVADHGLMSTPAHPSCLGTPMSSTNPCNINSKIVHFQLGFHTHLFNQYNPTLSRRRVRNGRQEWFSPRQTFHRQPKAIRDACSWKRESAGTGVFLPRVVYGHSEFSENPGRNSSALHIRGIVTPLHPGNPITDRISNQKSS